MVGEARAALFATEFAASRGWSSILLEGDNMQIVNAVRDREASSLADFVIYLDEPVALIISFSCFSIFFVRRSGNYLAHELAHLNLGSSSSLDVDVIPADLAHIL